ncbi:MAG: DUF4331 family protein [Vulcanimicrobiaceae bacterium]
MKRLATLAAASFLSLAAFSSCSNDPTLGGTDTSGSKLNFIQVDRGGKPGINEVFVPYAQHDANNRNGPLSDAATLAPEISTFVTGFAGRSAATSAYLQALLVPNVLVADLSQSVTTASYLGWETGGQIKANTCTGSAPNAFGGRAISDDVADVTFGIVFGNTLSMLSATPNVSAAIPADDGAELNGTNGTPNVASDGVFCSAASYTPGQFPYLGNPI